MYSLVLTVAMATAPEASNLHGGLFHGGMLNYWHSCYGCGSGCWSSHHGSCGGYAYGGGCWAAQPYQSYACSGCAGTAFMPYSCAGYGIYGGATYFYPTPYYGGPPGSYNPIPAANTMPRIEKVDETKKDDTKKDDIKKKDDKPMPMMMIYPISPNKAQVVVRLPADAKLFANDHLTNLNSSERSFTTPALEPGMEFEYVMKIQYDRNGKNVTDSRVVKVRAGKVSVVEFADRGESESAISKLQFNAPEGVKLFVDDKEIALKEGAKEYKTPRLVKGAEYAYTVRAELNKDGKTETQSQRVVFKAGEPVTVDFMDLGTIRTAAK